MRFLKQEIYFPTIVVGIHFFFWTIDLYFYYGSLMDFASDFLFGDLNNGSWRNVDRISGEIFCSWVVPVFAFGFLMASRMKWIERLFTGLGIMYLIDRRSVITAVVMSCHLCCHAARLDGLLSGKAARFLNFCLNYHGCDDFGSSIISDGRSLILGG